MIKFYYLSLIKYLSDTKSLETMKNITKIIKLPGVVIAVLLFIAVSFAAMQPSLAAEEPEPSENNATSKNGKYSKFFDEKTKWCDALVITCNDFRFTNATQAFVNERLGLKGNYDYLSIPGSIRNLLDSKTKDIVLKNFGISVRLHHVKRLIIIGHQDCSIGYGGSVNFSERADEYNTICADLKKARRLLRIRFSHLKIYLYYGTVFFKDHQRIYNFKQIL